MKKSLLLAAALVASASAFAQDALYVIGDDVNGSKWALAEESAKMTDEGNGIWSWDGEHLGTGFKINDGTWDNPAFNIGAVTGNDLVLGEPYYYMADGASGNFAFNGFTGLKNPHIELNLNDATITVTGEKEGAVSWYLAGVNGDFDFATMPEFTEVEDGVFEIAAVTFTEGVDSNIKVTDTGWAHQFGTYNAEEVFFSADNLFQELEPVGGEGGNVACELVGTYKAIFNLNEYTLEFIVSPGNSVEAIVDANAPVVYYNLQGAVVANPENGIFVKVQNGKAVKVVK